MIFFTLWEAALASVAVGRGGGAWGGGLREGRAAGAGALRGRGARAQGHHCSSCYSTHTHTHAPM